MNYIINKCNKCKKAGEWFIPTPLFESIFFVRVDTTFCIDMW